MGNVISPSPTVYPVPEQETFHPPSGRECFRVSPTLSVSTSLVESTNQKAVIRLRTGASNTPVVMMKTLAKANGSRRHLQCRCTLARLKFIMSEIVSHGIALLAGSFIGAVGRHFWSSLVAKMDRQRVVDWLEKRWKETGEKSASTEQIIKGLGLAPERVLMACRTEAKVLGVWPDGPWSVSHDPNVWEYKKGDLSL